MMEQWKKLLLSLSLRHRILIGVAAVAVAGGLYWFTQWRHDQDFKPLFTGVAAEDASPVIAKLKERAVEYRVTGDSTTTILVPSSKVSELRLEMAASGLPKTGRVGFELFDRTNLGTTDFAEHINYGRAVEGELERSIRHIREVEQARVHITFPKDSVFIESRQPAKASVLLSVKPGAKISSANVAAISHLVASAVEGLDPSAVSIVDTRGTLLSRAKRKPSEAEVSDEALELRGRMERDLLAKINGTLDPLLGSEKFRASVAVDVDYTSGEESSETYDPEKTVMLNSTRTEEASGSGGVAGVPGTASSLPRPAGKVSGGNSSTTRKSETISYQPTKTVRHTRIPQGSVKRMSVALLIDQGVRWDTAGKKQERVLIPPTPETIRSIREVVAASIALDTARGDQLVVESLPFEQTLSIPPPPLPSGSTPAAPLGFSIAIGSVDPKILAVTGAGGVVVLLIAGFVVFRSISRKKKLKVQQTQALPPPVDAKQVAEAQANELSKTVHDKAEQKRKLLLEAQEKLAMEPLITQKSEILVHYLRESIKTDPGTAVSVIRNWLYEEQ